MEMETSTVSFGNGNGSRNIARREWESQSHQPSRILLTAINEIVLHVAVCG